MQDHEDNPIDPIDESQWPSIDLAYGFVAPSYDWIQRRYESVERRTQTFLAFTATLTLGVPALMAALFDNLVPDFSSAWFIAAMIVAAVTLALGVASVIISNTSGIWYINPENVYQDWLDYSEGDFKKNAIYWAGQHFNSNVELITKMEWMLTGMLILFSIEAMLLLVWILTTLT